MSALFSRLPAAVLAAGLITVLAAAPALAHVTVNPSEAAKGGFQELSFRVPNEKDGATTTKVEVNFPTGTPIPFVSVKATPGWTYQVEKAKLAKPVQSDDGEVTEAVSRITWSGGSIKAGEYQDFDVSAGPLPDAGQLVFKALQTYSDGEVVRWIQESSGGEEPENPAPVLKLTAGDAAPAAATAPAGTVTAADFDAVKRNSEVALIVGAFGLAAGGTALLMTMINRHKATSKT
jgi:uncharacterized protein YcnI